MSSVARFVPGDTGGSGRASDRPDAPGAEVSFVEITPHVQESAFPTFALDLDRLARRGFVLQRGGPQAASGDIRAVKRRLLRRLNFLRRQESEGAAGSPMIVLVTSSEPEEGKTFLTTNLALSLATEERLKVLLVDGDLIKPSLASIFGVVGGRGFGESLRDETMDARSVIRRAKEIPLGLVTTSPDADAFTEALMRRSVASRLRGFASAFESRIVLVDGPPLLATTEAALLAEEMDEVVFVVRAGRTPAHRVTAALDLLSREDRISLVLNRAPFSRKTPDYRGYEPKTAV